MITYYIIETARPPHAHRTRSIERQRERERETVARNAFRYVMISTCLLVQAAPEETVGNN